jgi:hypothetical protein
MAQAMTEAAHWDCGGWCGNRHIARPESNSTPERAMELLLEKARLVFGDQDWSAWEWSAREYAGARHASSRSSGTMECGRDLIRVMQRPADSGSLLPRRLLYSSRRSRPRASASTSNTTKPARAARSRGSWR